MQSAFNFPIPEIDWSVVAPYTIMAVVGMLGLVIEMVKPKRSNDLISVLTLGACLLSSVLLAMQLGTSQYTALGDSVQRDTLAGSLQIAVLISTALCVLFSEPYLKEKRIAFGEFYSILAWAAVGAMLMIGSANLLILFLGLEILSIALYVMAGLSRSEEKSEESAMKYFLLGAFASAFLLFGIAFMYGATGSLQLVDITATWIRYPETHSLMVIGLAMILVGLGFKSSFVPFHQWTPDVYQGAPTNVTAFMATVAKVAAFAAVYRVLSASLPLSSYWMPAMTVVAMITMVVGNLIALTQKDVKRILAYSSIANAGYVLVGILAGVSPLSKGVGSQSMVYFLFSYSLTTIGAFAVLTMAARDGHEVTTLSDIKGLWQRSPLAAVTLATCMMSLIGIPPSAGFFGKFLIFRDAIVANMMPLAIVLAVSSAISIYFYLSVAFAAFAAGDESADSRLAKPSAALKGTCIVCLAGIFGLAIFFTPVMSMLSGNRS